MTIESVIQDLMQYFTFKMGDNRVQHYHNTFRKYGPELLKRAGETAKNRSQRFPTVNELAGYIKEQEIRDWQIAKMAEPKKLPEPQVADDEYTFEGWNLLNKATDRLISRGQLLAHMRIMDVAYPGWGWKTNADDLQAFYEKHGFEIDDLPRRSDGGG